MNRGRSNETLFALVRAVNDQQGSVVQDDRSWIAQIGKRCFPIDEILVGPSLSAIVSNFILMPNGLIRDP